MGRPCAHKKGGNAFQSAGTKSHQNEGNFPHVYLEVSLLDHGEDCLALPLCQLIECLLDCELRGGARLQVFDRLHLRDDEIRGIQHVLQRQFLLADTLWHLQHLEELLPVILREGIPFDEFEVGHILLEPLDF